ncbi:hypothetical protein [Rhizobium ruizarguesonis]|uniref:hypothetical protein n=1 Tax=Rhizobium ruizarguesonis TaxID=2081791 RepID=UPI0010306F8A|nr:hypothetical protein [Rhizobium ruizarguesonis]TBA03105.1 hypothetical protein ELH64_01110 [Rhizobium ruizarguesonis]
MSDKVATVEIPVFLGSNYTAILKDAEERHRSMLSGSEHALRKLVGYAPPMVWGPEVTVASHIGSVTFNISYEAVGDTLVIGRVIYFKGEDSGKQVTEEFKDDTTITTSDSVANVRCQFKGIPTGSAVDITCDP